VGSADLFGGWRLLVFYLLFVASWVARRQAKIIVAHDYSGVHRQVWKTSPSISDYVFFIDLLATSKLLRGEWWKLGETLGRCFFTTTAVALAS
jgi:hypothetical protein